MPQVLGYTVIASSSTAVKQDYNEYMWTLSRDFVVAAVVEPVVAVAASDAVGDHQLASLAIGSSSHAANAD